MSKFIIKENKLKSLIKESVQHILYEFMQTGFSFEDLDKLPQEDKYNYCLKYLGEPIGQGSSRVAFEIDDMQVLKLAKSTKYQAGIEQNEAEYNYNRKINSPLLIKVLYHSDDYSWIITERVLPCQEIDLFKILGISQNMYRPFEINAEEKYNKKNPDLLGYEDYRIKKQNTPQGHTISFGAIITAMKHLIEGTDIEYVKDSYPYECEVINNHPWFKELFNLCKNHQLMIGDVAVQNMGITLRNGKPAVVILDSGLTEEILNKHYKYF